ncbi:PP2C family protein-serine/threonine phosphatase [Kocuria rosea]|uniref:PP2C family protein-serine/threonine phosphatase n=2 Tax=Kocuria TaxID=57493 RepID=UPI00203DCDF9|nr:SpoIIE family protein phosphatase [Kocuria rosea]MCM3687307.1 SpoIIE family protein phosphatase [Kocuria rosea]
MTVDAGTPEEAARVRALHALNVLDTPKEERYDRVVRIAQQVFGVKAAAVNLIDADRQFTKAETGLDGLVHAARTDSLCARTVEADAPLVVPDAVVEARFAGSAFIAGPDPVRFYAGHPLHAPGGEPVGSLCLVDDRPRELDARERRLLAEMAGWVERELAAQDEMDRAAQVQQMLMPRTGLLTARIEAAGRCLPARSLGGDFYDWMVLGEDLQVMVADVMGKGIPAALLAASARAVLRGTFQYNAAPEAMARAAGALTPLLEEAGAFVTAFIARLDTSTGVLEYIDAGHGLALILSPDGASRRLSNSGPAVGLVAGWTWEIHTDTLEPGQTLLVVSDGFLDFFDDLEQALATAAALNTVAATAEELVRLCSDYADSPEADDDTTVLALRRLA